MEVVLCEVRDLGEEAEARREGAGKYVRLLQKILEVFTKCQQCAEDNLISRPTTNPVSSTGPWKVAMLPLWNLSKSKLLNIEGKSSSSNLKIRGNLSLIRSMPNWWRNSVEKGHTPKERCKEVECYRFHPARKSSQF